MKLKIIPTNPNPYIPQKTFCWIQLVGGGGEPEEGLEEEEGVSPPETTTAAAAAAAALIQKNNSGTLAQAQDLIGRDYNNYRKEQLLSSQEEEKKKLMMMQKEEEIDSIRDWSRHHPCIIVSAEEKVKIGDCLWVHLQHGDPTKPYYRPYQIHTQLRMKKLIIKSSLYSLLCVLALYFLYGGSAVPVIFASSQDVQDAVNGFWDRIFQALHLQPNDDDPDDENDLKEDEEKNAASCQIPLHIAFAYDFLILLQFLVIVIVPLQYYRKTKKLWGMVDGGEPPADNSYHLLRGDEDELDEVDERATRTTMKALMKASS